MKKILAGSAFCVFLTCLFSCNKTIIQPGPVDDALSVPLPSLNSPLQVQQLSGYEDYSNALEHAPILWYEDSEEYFPSLPFFSALDSIDNNKNGRRDFQDLEEIAPLAGKSQVLWDSLFTWYTRLPIVMRKRLATVFYRVREEKVPKSEMTDLLKSDEQLWRRWENEWTEVGSDSFNVFEYYLYYIYDRGLQGHPEDMEVIFVFVPKPPEDYLRFIVGAGHSGFVPNNVLLYQQRNGNKVIPAEFSDHPHILVELGGHSNAPDIKGDGSFDPGQDANWHAEFLWGTRDIQAVAGRGATAKYSTWMTFHRRRVNKIYPPDPKLLGDFNISDEILASLKKNHMPDSVYNKLEQLKDQKFETQRHYNDSLRTVLGNDYDEYSQNVQRNYYRLLPVELFRSLNADLIGYQKLMKSIKPASAAQDSLKISTANIRISSKLSSLKKASYEHANFEVSSDSLIPDTVLNSMYPWTRKLKNGSGIKRFHQPWEHQYYKNKPTYIFKNYLYRPRYPFAFGLWTQIEGASDLKSDLRLAWIVPVFARFPVKLDGVLEIQGGLRFESFFSGKTRGVAVINYERYYSNTVSWYLSGSWVNNRKDASDVMLGGGISFLPPFINPLGVRPLNLIHWLRLRVGVTGFDLGTFKFNQARLVIQLGVHY